MWFIKEIIGLKKKIEISDFFCEMLTSLQYKCVNKQTNTLSPSPKCFQSPSPRTSEKSADSDSDVRKALLFTFPLVVVPK
jgi:hypothetical protein